MKRFEIRLPKKLHEKIRRESFETGKSMNEITVEMIENNYKEEKTMTEKLKGDAKK